MPFSMHTQNLEVRLLQTSLRESYSTSSVSFSQVWKSRVLASNLGIQSWEVEEFSKTLLEVADRGKWGRLLMLHLSTCMKIKARLVRRNRPTESVFLWSTVHLSNDTWCHISTRRWITLESGKCFWLREEKHRRMLKANLCLGNLWIVPKSLRSIERSLIQLSRRWRLSVVSMITSLKLLKRWIVQTRSVLQDISRHNNRARKKN